MSQNLKTYIGCISQDATTGLFDVSVTYSWFEEPSDNREFGNFMQGITPHHAKDITTLGAAERELRSWYPGMRSTHRHPESGNLEPPVYGRSAFHYYIYDESMNRVPLPTPDQFKELVSKIDWSTVHQIR